MNELNAKKQIIANRLREARKLAKLSQGEVAKRLDMHRPTITEIEAGNRSVSAEELGGFAEIYDVGISWLSGQGAEKLDPQDDRLQLAFRELKKLKPDDIDKLINILAAIREGTEPLASPAANSTWTDERNARRCELIDKKVQGQISREEAVELDRLQQSMRRHVHQAAPLPFEAAKRLHAELLQKKHAT